MSQISCLRRVALLGTVVASVTVLAACGGSSSNSGKKGSSADATATLRYGAFQDLLSFDPAKANAGGDQGLYLGMVYDNLVTYDAQGKLVPQLASSFKQDSPTHYTFTLHTGVTYQDGSAFTATTVKQDLERVIASGGPRATLLAPIETISAVNPTTVTMTLKTPSPDLLPTLATATGAMLSPQAFNRSNLSRNPDGTGPYVYDASASAAGDHYTFTAKPQWWDSANVPRPHTVVFKVLTDDTARLNALKTNQVDIATINASGAAEAKGSGLKVINRASTWTGLTILDRNGQTVPALGSQKVRQAMALALNRPALVKAASFGYGQPSAQVFAKGTPGYDASLDSAYAYNVKKAKQLITESGFKNITFTAPIAATYQSLAEAMQGQLAAVGITMKLQLLPTTALAAAARTTKFPVLTFPFPNIQPYARYKAIWAPKAGFNPFHVDDPTLDSLTKQFAAATTTDAQNTAAKKINDEVVNSGIAIVAEQPDDVAAYSSKLQGVNMSIYLVPQLRGIHF